MNFSRNLTIKLMMVFLYITLTTSVGNSQDDAGINYIALTDIGNIDPSLDQYKLSQSGQKLAVINKESLCIYDIDTLIYQCDALAWGDNYSRGINGMQGFVVLEWSSDEQYVVFSREPLAGGQTWDTDIWLYDIAAQEILNLTDDGVQDSYISFEESAIEPQILDIPVDTLPFWDTSSRDIYFFRAYPEETGLWLDRLGLYRVSLDNFSVTQIYDFTDYFVSPVYNVVLSPDANKIAMSIGGSRINEGATGVWLLDLQSNTLDYKFPVSAFDAFLPEGMDYFGLGNPALAWLSNDQLAFVLQSFKDVETSLPEIDEQYFLIDVETLSIEPLNLPEPASIFSSMLFLSNDTQTAYFIFLDRESDDLVQNLYLGKYTEEFQFVAQLPIPSAAWEQEKIHSITENNRIISGGLIIEVPTMP